MSEPAFTPARRGDLAALVTTVRERTLHYDHTARRRRTRVVLVHVVATASDGRITRVRRVQDEENDACDLAGVPGAHRLAVIPARVIDVAGAIDAARGHRTVTGRPFAPFASLDELREALRPHLKTAAS